MVRTGQSEDVVRAKGAWLIHSKQRSRGRGAGLRYLLALVPHAPPVRPAVPGAEGGELLLLRRRRGSGDLDPPQGRTVASYPFPPHPHPHPSPASSPNHTPAAPCCPPSGSYSPHATTRPALGSRGRFPEETESPRRN